MNHLYIYICIRRLGYNSVINYSHLGNQARDLNFSNRLWVLVISVEFYMMYERYKHFIAYFGELSKMARFKKFKYISLFITAQIPKFKYLRVLIKFKN